jgi:hypothetical protein
MSQNGGMKMRAVSVLLYFPELISIYLGFAITVKRFVQTIA